MEKHEKLQQYVFYYFLIIIIFYIFYLILPSFTVYYEDGSTNKVYTLSNISIESIMTNAMLYFLLALLVSDVLNGREIKFMAFSIAIFTLVSIIIQVFLMLAFEQYYQGSFTFISWGQTSGIIAMLGLLVFSTLYVPKPKKEEDTETSEPQVQDDN
ncbi:MAG: hypothetical protein INQ03_20825 [Candidatus Heimdallarchaeota archaeon]|nr:hypothetical protein [Candidatus Heimdallarchaeota archaeon]